MRYYLFDPTHGNAAGFINGAENRFKNKYPDNNFRVVYSDNGLKAELKCPDELNGPPSLTEHTKEEMYTIFQNGEWEDQKDDV